METKSQVKEEWRDIQGYVGRYQVSDQGRVRSIRTIKGKKVSFVLKPWSCSHFKNRDKKKKYTNYLRVCFFKPNVRPFVKKYYCVHILVWEAFKGKKPAGLTIDHINEDKFDNRLSNLQLLTMSANIRKSSYSHYTKRHKYRYLLELPDTSFYFESTCPSDIFERLQMKQDAFYGRFRYRNSFVHNGIKVSRRLIYAQENDK